MSPSTPTQRKTWRVPVDDDMSLLERVRQKKDGFMTYRNDRRDDDEDEESESGMAPDSEQQQDPTDERKPQRHADRAMAQEQHDITGGKVARANKNCPLELPSKSTVGRLRQVVQVPRRRVVDPRFERTAGKLNQDLFAKSYAFLDEYKERELGDMKKQLKRVKSAAKRDELKQEIAVRSQERAETHKQEKIQAALRKRKLEERDAVASGKTPFYLKRKDKKKVELQARFEDLQESGRLSKFMAKKRKKNASKDHRWLPTQRKT